MQDLTGAAIETFSHDPDELHRLFYTGATRAKRELHVLDPKNFDRAYDTMKHKVKIIFKVNLLYHVMSYRIQK